MVNPDGRLSRATATCASCARREEQASDRAPATLYCDESGNTGPNYIDTDQPFYVTAGILVFDQDLHALEAAVRTVRASISTTAPELHGSRLLRSSRGSAAVASFLRELLLLPVEIFIYVYEKRYGLCGRIVDDCLDGAYNPRVSIRLTGDNTAKCLLADRIYQLSPQRELRQWADGWRRGDAKALRIATLRLCAAISRAGDPQLAHALRGSLNAVEEFAAGGGPTALESVNYPVLIALLGHVEYFCDLKGYGPVMIIHDEIRKFGRIYQEYVRTFRAPGGKYTYLAGKRDRPAIATLKWLISLRNECSRDVLPLQAADIVASSIGWYARRASAGTSFEPTFQGIRDFMNALNERDSEDHPSGIVYALSSTVAAKVLDLDHRCSPGI